MKQSARLHTGKAMLVPIVSLLIMGTALGKVTMASLNEQLLRAAYKGSGARAEGRPDKGAGINGVESHRNTPLIKAARQDNLSQVRFLVENGADVNVIGFEGATPLLWVIWRGQYYQGVIDTMTGFQSWSQANSIKPGLPSKRSIARAPLDDEHLEAIRMLLAYEADVNQGVDLNPLTSRRAPLEHGSTPLVWSAVFGYVELAKMLIDNGADVNAKLSDGSTAMMWASLMGNTEMAALLTRHGAQDSLILAAIRCDKPAVERCLSGGAGVDVREEYGRTALMEAVLCGNIKLVELLLQHGADVNARDNRGSTALMEAITHGRRDAIELLLKNRADVNIADANGKTPLIKVVASDDMELSRLFLDHRADINAMDVHGRSALMHAVLRKNRRIVKLLLDRGAAPDSRDVFGKTQLMAAIEYGSVPIAKMLLEKGADTSIPAPDGRSVMETALINWDADMARLLHTFGVPADLSIAALLGDILLARKRISEGADVNYTTDYGRTPLMCAAAMGHAEIVRLLLSRDAAVNVQDPYGWTALMWAARKGRTESVELLISRGADIHALTRAGRTPLIWAIWRGHADTAHVLLKKGARTTSEDWSGRSIRYYAKGKPLIRLILWWHEKTRSSKETSE